MSFIKHFFLLGLKYKKMFYTSMFLNIININSMNPLLALNNLTFLYNYPKVSLVASDIDCTQLRRSGFNPWVRKIPLGAGMEIHCSTLA